jgi:hypothetical protein
MAEIMVDLLVVCSNCSSTLEFDQVGRNIYVEPCEKCIEDAQEEERNG